MKEKQALEFMEQSGLLVMCHDDRLLIRGQKSEIGITEHYRENAPIREENGRGKVCSFIKWDDKGKAIDRVKPTEYEQLTEEEQREYIPHFVRGGKLGDRITYEMKCNQIDIRICDLFNDTKSRYRKALDNIVKLYELGIINYRPIKDRPTEKNVQEAIRHRLKAYMRPTEYEHDILFSGEIGRAIYRDILKNSENINGTLYLKGFKEYERQRAKLKYYDIGERSGAEAGKNYKAEVTILKGYFKYPTGGRERIKINELLEQPDIQELLKEQLKREYSTLLKSVSQGTLDMISNELLKETRDEWRGIGIIAEELLKRNRTYQERLEQAERELIKQREELKRRERKKRQ
jgi:hypothetical protein